MQEKLICQCIDVRTGEIKIPGGSKPVFIMHLHNETINEPLIKFFNCNSTTAGKYKVPHNSAFAKLYRLTFGENPTKRFSEAHKLRSHFCGNWFVAKCEKARLSNGEPYLKATDIEAQNPCKNDAWTLDGTLKKTSKKMVLKPPKIADKQRTNGGKTEEKWRTNGGRRNATGLYFTWA